MVSSLCFGGRAVCGFAGWFDGFPSDQAVLEAMTHSLVHRGPDAFGFYAKGPFGVGHRRLKIIDLAGSSQPMVSSDGRYVLAFNGEIYNFQELRFELEALGYRFTTSGDTEVLFASLITWGESGLSKLSGMFSFVFWDAKEEILLLARDHLGVKPLYFYHDEQRIVFASEIKALLLHPVVPREIAPNAIGLYLECQYIPSPYTIFQKIEKLPPAHMLVVKAGSISKRCYWTPSYEPKWECDRDGMLFLFESELRRSIRSMLVADVPVGAFVSGGIDSSLIASLMQQEGARNLSLFSIALEGTHGEQHYAALVAERLGVPLHSFVVQPEDFMNAFDHSFDEPLGDQAILPTLVLSQLTKKSVSVVLTGEGADEILAGYGNYLKRMKEAQFLAQWHSFFPSFLYPFFPSKLRKSRLCKALARPLSRRYATIPSLFDREMFSSLFKRPFLMAQTHSLEEIAEQYFKECDGKSYLDKMLHIDTRLWLSDDLLTKVDRATMAHSIEARVPYLDHQLVSFVARLPVDCKLAAAQGKFFLRQVARKGYLPSAIIERPKRGFVMPLGEWMQGPLSRKVEEALLEGGLLDRNLLRPSALRRFVREKKKSDAGRLFALMSLEYWFRSHVPDWSLTENSVLGINL